MQCRPLTPSCCRVIPFSCVFLDFMPSLISSQPYTCFSDSLLAVSPYCTFGYQRIYSLTISLNCTSSLFIQILGLRCRFSAPCCQRIHSLTCSSSLFIQILCLRCHLYTPCCQRIHSLTCTSSLFIQILGLRCHLYTPCCQCTHFLTFSQVALHFYSSRSFACDVIYTHPAANVHTSLHFLKLHFISIPNSWPKFPHGRTGSHVNRPDVPLSHLNPDSFLILSSVRLYCKSRSLHLLFSRFTLLYQTFCLGYSHFVSLYCIFSHVPAA